MLAILMAMQIQQCNAGHIAQWSASVASCKATRCHHRASANTVSPWRLPWPTIWMKQKNTNKTQLLPSFLVVDQHQKAKQFWDLKQTLYSRHQCNKLHTNVKHHYLSWRAKLHFELSNIINGQKFKKLLTLNKAKKNLWAKYSPIVVSC